MGRKRESAGRGAGDEEKGKRQKKITLDLGMHTWAFGELQPQAALYKPVEKLSSGKQNQVQLLCGEGVPYTGHIPEEGSSGRTEMTISCHS